MNVAAIAMRGRSVRHFREQVYCFLFCLSAIAIDGNVPFSLGRKELSKEEGKRERGRERCDRGWRKFVSSVLPSLPPLPSLSPPFAFCRRCPNGFLGLSLNYRTFPFLVMYYWLGQSQSDKTVFALGRSPLFPLRRPLRRIMMLGKCTAKWPSPPPPPPKWRAKEGLAFLEREKG